MTKRDKKADAPQDTAIATSGAGHGPEAAAELAAVRPGIDGDPAGAQPDQSARDRVALEHAETSLALLEAIARDHSLLAQLDPELRRKFVIAAGQVSRPDRDGRRALRRNLEKRDRVERRDQDAALLDSTGIRNARAAAVFQTPSADQIGAPKRLRRLPPRSAPIAPSLFGPTGEFPATESVAEPERLRKARNCYVCKKDFHVLHDFYDAMCTECADFNWMKRIQTADLSGRVALVTGGRVKIGYQAVIKLLRAGARVIVSTRFPRDAAARYSQEADFGSWSHRLEIHGLDLRHIPSVEAFAKDIDDRHRRLDFILNNACQTVRRPPSFYAHMMEGERAALEDLPEEQRALLQFCSNGEVSEASGLALTASGGSAKQLLSGLDRAADLSQVPLLPEDLAGGALFPANTLDADLQQVDMRGRNSWRLALDEVSTIELLEVQLVNAVSPFVLNARLKSLMMKGEQRDKHIVNVSAMEGQFYRNFKTDKHPHTNMAKAALNMMTRTSAPDYARVGIHMNSVDTGWITDEDPIEIAMRKQKEQGFHPPLDIVDAAARICDPIFSGFNSGVHLWGQFLKDYRPTDW